ncbi:MAG TPA: hypothetical protein VMT05_09965 [Terriglobales bacterium]|jgi:hypothetical protein|nr:hypothetical protein [Terriglobales bacterium]
MSADSLNPYLYSTFHALFAIGVCAIAWFHPRLGDRWFHAAEAGFSRFATQRKSAIASVFLVAVVVRLALLPWLHVPVPGNPDEFSYLLMGDTFAHGRLAYPSHAMWQSFESLDINWFPTYSSMFFPAQGAVLAAGELLGHPWIGVLASAGLMCAALVWALQAWMPARWAMLGGVLAILNIGVLSYWMNSYWGGAVAGTGGALVLGAVPRVLRKQRVRDALLLGIGAAILANSRPFEGLILCLPFAIALLVWMGNPSSPSAHIKFWKVIVPVCAILVPTFAFMGYYNWRLTGNPLQPPHLLWSRTYLTSPYFFWDHQKPLLHYNNQQLEEVFRVWAPAYASRTWAGFWKLSGEKIALYWEVFLWAGAFPILLCVPLLLRDRRMRWLLGAALICLAGLFSVTWSLPHYAAPAFCVFYAILVQALRHLRALRFRGRPVGLGLSRAAIVLLFFQVATAIPERLHHPDAWFSVRGNEDRALLSRRLHQLPGKHLVLVRYGENHDVIREWVYNGADIDDSKVVWAREMSATQNAKLLAYYGNRHVWLVEPEHNPDLLLPYPRAR